MFTASSETPFHRKGNRRESDAPVSLLRLILFLAASVLLAGAAIGQVSSSSVSSRQLEQAEADVRAVDRALDSRIDADARKLLRGKASTASASASDAVQQLQDQVALLQARIDGLGAVTAGMPEALDIHSQRVDLIRQRTVIDAAIKRGRLTVVEATQLVEEMDRSAADQFSHAVSIKVKSPLTPAFWRAIIVSVPRDIRRIDLFLAGGSDQIRANWRGGFPWQAPLALMLGAIVLFPLRSWARHVGQQYLIQGAPGHRLRRSGNALWRVVIGTSAPLLAASIAVQGLRWSRLLPEGWSDLLDAFVGAFGFAGFTAAVAGAMLMRTQPSWRIAQIDDQTATRLRPLSWFLAGLAGVTFMLTAFNETVGASQAAQVAAQALEALLYLIVIGTFLLILGKDRAQLEDDVESDAARTGLGIAMLFVSLLGAFALVALLAGYVGVSLFISAMMAWAAVLGSALYLAMTLADDLATTMFANDSRLGMILARSLGIRPSVVAQFGLLLSGCLRLALAMMALGLLLTPFGAGGGLGAVFGRLGALGDGVEIGGVSISPIAIFRGVVVLGIGLALVRMFMRWLEARYLPATDLDGSGRNSVSLVARYVGVALAVVWALASLGIGVERVALLLSALSVGIGFGLQAITQNFVSGLILLAERPIRIGDLIRVGSDEGDVKRISVRSTEIELGDHSTLIVPNSELITKSVLNKTVSGRPGRIQIQFSIPLGTDAKRIRDMVLEVIHAEEGVLNEPEPAVFIDGIADDRILINCFAHVSSPRAVYRTRSNILMELLDRLRLNDVDTRTVANGGEEPSDSAPTRINS